MTHHEGTDLTSPVAAILRHQLFLPSERFIPDQAMALRRFRPLFVARDAVQDPVPGAEAVSLASSATRAEIVRYKLLRRTRTLGAILETHHPRLIHAHFGVEGVYALPLARRLNLPLVTTFHGFDASLTRRRLVRSKRPSWVNFAAFRSDLARKGTLFVCVSDHVREKVLRFGFPPERVVRHHIGVDTKRFYPGPDDRPPRVLHVARLVEIKGTADLIRAFAQVRVAHPDAQLDIVGDGPLAAALKSLADELGVAAQVQFLGTRSHAEVAELMRNSAVFCLPSSRPASGAEEGLPMVLLEAAASGTPAVGTRHGGIPEAIDEGVSGLLIGESSPAQLADALSQLLRDTRLAREMGAAARRRVETQFDLGRQTALLEDLYTSVL